MRLVSPLLKNVVYPALCYTGRLKHMAPSAGCAVVNYHGVLPRDYAPIDPILDGNLASAAVLQRHLRFLKSHYEVISPDDFRCWIRNSISLPARAVLVTCDDGLLNNLTCMLPVLKEEAVHCLFFITGGSLRESKTLLWYEELYHLLREMGPDADLHSRWWQAVRTDSRLNATAREEKLDALRRQCHHSKFWACEERSRLLNLQELRQLADSGMTIGAHTLSHPILAECSDEESFHEIQESKIRIEAALERPVWAFAYPFGNPETMGEREIRFAQQAGFECAFLNVGGGFADRSSQFAFPRTHTTAHMSIAELEAHMTGFHAQLQRAVRGYSS